MLDQVAGHSKIKLQLSKIVRMPEHRPELPDTIVADRDLLDAVVFGESFERIQNPADVVRSACIELVSLCMCQTPSIFAMRDLPTPISSFSGFGRSHLRLSGQS